MAQNEAGKTFLQNSANGSGFSLDVLKVLGVSVVLVILLVGLSSAYCLKKRYENKLSQIDAFIKEIQNLKTEGFLRGKDYFKEAGERNENLINALKNKASLFSIKSLDRLFGDLKSSASNILKEEMNASAYKTEIEMCKSFLKKAKKAYRALKEVSESFDSFKEKEIDYRKNNAEAIDKIIQVLKKWRGVDLYNFKGVDLGYEVLMAYSEKRKILEGSINNIIRILEKYGNLYWAERNGYSKKFRDCLVDLNSDIEKFEEKLQEIEGPLNAAMEKFNEKKRKILDALTNIKKEKEKKGIFGSLWSSNQPVLNENNQQ